jgi:hypothetical protein
MENFTDDKKKRSSNWDSSVITLLQHLVQENMSTLRSKLTNSVTNSRKISIWKNIAVQINSLGLQYIYRTDKEVKTKWQNMQTSAKKQYADRNKYATQTGGGPPAKKFSNETEKIVDMMKDCSSFVGLQGGESSINLTEGAYIIIDISNILKKPADFCLH